MKHTRLLPPLLAFTLALGAPVAPSAGEPTAVTAKKKCKKALWKCAPKHYRLEARGVVAFPTGSQSWKADIMMRKWRASSGQVQYAQDGGTLTLRASWTGEGPTTDHPTCEGTIQYEVPEQTMRLPKGDGFRFNAFLSFYLIGGKKGKYDFIVADAYELAEAAGTSTCPSAGSMAQFPYWMQESRKFTVLTPGKPGARRLTGSRAARGDSIRWTLTRK